MWPATSAAHAEPMITHHEIAKVLVAEHQRELERSATRARLASLVRQARHRAPAVVTSHAPITLPAPAPSNGTGPEQAAA
jgi:hypothetical protein